MKIIFFAQFIPDPCGAFFHDMILARALQSRGHNVHIITLGRKFPQRGVYNGISFSYYESSGKEISSADILSTPHYPVLQFVRKLNESYEKPLVITMHYGEDTNHIEKCTRTGKWAEFLWFVSPNIEKKVLSTITIAPSFVDTHLVRPTFIQNDIKLYEQGQKPEGDCITLINANVLKGIEVFIDIAKRFPDRKFLAVKPYYNIIRVPTDIPNIEWIDIQDDIKNVLKRTRILLVPSAYESWGRVAFEAMYNGIPVIYTKPADSFPGLKYKSGTTQGMKEWIVDAAIDCDRTNIEEWISAIKKLDDETIYMDYSDRGHKCTDDMDIFSEIPDIEKRMFEYAVKHASPSKSKAGVEISQQPVYKLGMNRITSSHLRRFVNPAQQAVVPQQPEVQTQPRQVSSLGLPGGRFGMRR
jgi:glycosyltransferase involved in cell wall biosynthesis